MDKKPLQFDFGAEEKKPETQTYVFGDSSGVMPPKQYTLGEAIQAAPKHFIPSAIEVGKSLVQPVLHPIETAQALGQVGKGVYSKAKGLVTNQAPTQKAEDEAAIDAVLGHYGRYFSKEGLTRALAEDPAGMLADVGSLLTGGLGAAARVPGRAGSIATKAANVAKYADPMSLAVKTLEQVPKVTALPTWWHSGASFKSLEDAAKAGATKNEAFLKHISGQGDIGQVVGSVRNAAYDLMEERSKAYEAGMAKVGKNPAILPYDNVMNTYDKLEQGTKSIGKIYDQPTYAALKDAEKEIVQWWGQPSAPGAHTIYDFDKLKRNIGRIRDQYRPGTPEHRALGELYDSVKTTINNADPEYGKIMETYAEKTREINDIMREIAGPNSASQPARMRKLLKAYKDPTVSELMEKIVQKDPDLPFKLAGEELREGLPKGLRGYIASAGTMMGGAPIASLITASPRVGGYMQYGVGRTLAPIQKGMEAIPPAGRFAAYQVGESARTAQDAANQFQPLAEEDQPMEITVPVGIQPPQQADGGRVGRADGGRIDIQRGVRALMRAAENAKKDFSKTTETLLDQPDETIAQALSIAKKHI